MKPPQKTAGGWKLPLFGKGHSPLLAKNHNAVVTALNALGNLKIVEGVEGEAARWVYSDGNVVLVIPPSFGGGSGVGSLQTYRLKSRVGDVLICRTWNGTDEGPDDVLIAKNRSSRNISSETIAGVTYTYSSYTDIDSFNSSRISNDGSTEETQIVTPMWYENCEIDAMATNYSGVSNLGVDLSLIEVSARCWAKATAE